MKLSTSAVHGGVLKDETFNSVITPIYPSSTYRFDKIGQNRGFDYTRSGNPTRSAVEENIAALEGGSRCHCTATGMAAVTAVLHLLKSGDHIIAGHDIYGGTFRLLSDIITRWDVEVSFVDMREPRNVEKAARENTKMIWIETPSNPLMNIVDIKEVCKIAGAADAYSVVDNTFMSPYFQKPLELGADIVIHSTTKYINGHSDVVGGAIVSANETLGDKIQYFVNGLGVGESPFDSWLVLRGVKTLPLRMEMHAANAGTIAEFLLEHPKVDRVYYPGIRSHPGYELAKQQMSGYGGMLSFDLSPQKDMDEFFGKLRFFSLAESLGGVESLIEAPYFMSHASMNEAARKAAGILPQNVRVSAGIEDPEDLIEDLEKALG